MAKYRENSVEIAALNEEARRRGMTYGQLVAATTREEREGIIKRWRNWVTGRRKQENESGSETGKRKRRAG